MLVIDTLTPRKFFEVFLNSISIKLFSVATMKLRRQEQCFSWDKFRLWGWEEGTYQRYSYFWRKKLQVSALLSSWEKEWLAFLAVLIIGRHFLRHSGSLGHRTSPATAPHARSPCWMASLPYFPALGLTCFLLMSSVENLANLSPQRLYFHQKECHLFPTKENWDSSSFLTGI